jgi:hypothetical protein
VRPASPTSAFSGARIDSSMSVAASSAGASGSSARSMIPERICTLERADRPRATIWSFCRSSSREQVIFMVGS